MTPYSYCRHAAMVRGECSPLRRIAWRGLSPSQLPVCAFCAVLHQLQDEGEQVPVHGLHLYDVCAAADQSLSDAWASSCGSFAMLLNDMSGIVVQYPWQVSSAACGERSLHCAASAMGSLCAACICMKSAQQY